MKQIISIIIIMLTLVPLGNAQEPFKQSLSGIKKVSLKASTDMKVEVTQGNELILDWGKICDGCDDNGNYNDLPYVREQVEKKRNKAKGLKAIYADGVDNTGFGMQLDRDGEVLRIKDLKPITQRRSFTIKIPKGVSLEVDTSTLGSVDIDGFSDELEVTSNVGHVKLVNVTGPITASTSTGPIDVIFTTVSQNSPISLTTSTGDIDVTLPSNTNANVELRSTMGTVYSNFDLVKPREDGLKNITGNRKIKGTLNNGGVKVYLSSSTGDIYLRKQ
ncbi:MAG: DUF4097 family beta strand repeat-containing protein [Bacteroidota bacterium]